MRQFLAAALIVCAAGCASIDQLYKDKIEGELPWNKTNEVAQVESIYPPEIDTPVKWLHFDVSGWPVTADMTAAIQGGQIVCNYSKAKVWAEKDGVNANPWVFAKVNGQWYAATYEWYRVGQISKPVGVLDGSMGDHIKRNPLSSWRPRSGERIGLMVSGLARTSSRNVKERTPIVMVTWP